MPAAGKANCLLGGDFGTSDIVAAVGLNVYHQCVIEKGLRRRGAACAMRTAQGIGRMCQHNLRSRRNGDALKFSWIML